MKQITPSQIENITFGVEIETSVPSSTMIVPGGYHAGRPINAAQVNGALVESPKFNGIAWKGERDISIATSMTAPIACEFVSPILKGEAGLRHVVEFVAWLRTIGAEVNSSTGIHIHIGASGAAAGHELTDYVARLSRLANFNARALYAQTGTLSREEGAHGMRYCATASADDRRRIARAVKRKDASQMYGNRYSLLNLNNLLTRGTVEFRCFAGSRNTAKVLLHLFSVLSLVIIARTTKTPAQWDNRPLSGTKALQNLLKVRPLLRIVGTEVFAVWHNRMISKAMEMADKYDKALALRDLRQLSR